MLKPIHFLTLYITTSLSLSLAILTKTLTLITCSSHLLLFLFSLPGSLIVSLFFISSCTQPQQHSHEHTPCNYCRPSPSPDTAPPTSHAPLPSIARALSFFPASASGSVILGLPPRLRQSSPSQASPPSHRARCGCAPVHTTPSTAFTGAPQLHTTQPQHHHNLHHPSEQHMHMPSLSFYFSLYTVVSDLA